jgi:hypothetical protein
VLFDQRSIFSAEAMAYFAADSRSYDRDGKKSAATNEMPSNENSIASVRTV